MKAWWKSMTPDLRSAVWELSAGTAVARPIGI